MNKNDKRQLVLADLLNERLATGKRVTMADIGIDESTVPAQQMDESISAALKNIANVIKGIGIGIANDPKFQEFVSKYDAKQVFSKISAAANEARGKYQLGEKHKKLGAMLFKDIGVTSLAAIITYGSYRGTKSIVAQVEKKYGRAAGIAAKVLGYPTMVAVSGLIWVMFFMYKRQILSEVNKMVGQKRLA